MGTSGSFIGNTTSLIRERLARAFPSAFGFSLKHDFGKDYGWPDQLTFEHFYRMYSRSGLAAAGVDKTIAKTWQTMPTLWESEKPAESTAEGDIRKHFTRKKIWRALMDCDRRSMVGCYAGAIILVRDGKKLEEPVERVSKGIENFVGIIPAWEGQLSVVEWDTSPTSDTYGDPLFYQFDEQAVGEPSTVGKSQVRIHRDRVLIWSDDGTVNGSSALEPGFNDLTDAAKIKGAGGEGFWKSARGAPIIEAPKGVSPQDVQRGMNAATPADVIDKLNATVDDFQSGFDKALMLGSFSVSPLTITLPQPKEFWELAAQGFAASISIPVKVLIGNVTGERASTEDANEWAQTNMSRRENRVLPILYDLIDRLVIWGILDAKDWTIGWQDLTEASPDAKLDRAAKMSTINQQAGSEPVFLPDEIRDEAGFKAADEVEGFDEFLAERADRARQMAEDAATQTIPGDQQP
ncbi:MULTISPECIES: phage portal protein [unclassified Sphingomonas]|uniref:anti-CBASS protein Acb1 family protein n=1 Tax=unclassified Sphingomonas TaxID=196159 RepID=UPI0025EF093B|nr:MULTISPECIES: anti-CBASS Acb1 family protein [unclassified Sphingomonas]